MKGVLCFYCTKAIKSQKSPLAKNADPAFVHSGFLNLSGALFQFSPRACSHAHKVAVTTRCHQSKPVDTQLSTVRTVELNEARSCLRKVAGSVHLLACQGSVLRGHEATEHNLYQLLKVRAEDGPVLTTWLKLSQDHTSSQIQNKILSILANSIVRDITKRIHHLPLLQYSRIIDGTQDVWGIEQESFCFRYVVHDLVPLEDFVGFYEVSLTTEENLAEVATDVLLHLNVPLSGLSGQTYDGAANMSGKIKETQARLIAVQPLALYVHCGPHSVNLVTQAACPSSAVT